MIKEAIQYIVGLGKVELFEKNGVTYSDKKVFEIAPPTANPLRLSSLSGLVDYIKTEFDTDDKVMVHIESPTQVSCFSSVNNVMTRHQWARSDAWETDFRFDSFYDTESFVVKLQSTFVPNDHRAIMLQVVGNIKEEDVRTIGDDGTSQSVVAKTGVASVGNVKVPNPVMLAPYRTFVEVEQPESEFIFRMQSGPRCALFEADGGYWKIDTMNRIEEYLEKALDTEIKDGQVHLVN